MTETEGFKYTVKGEFCRLHETKTILHHRAHASDK